MKCPDCKTEMEKGVLNGATWSHRTLDALVGKLKTIIAWKCPNCEKIELYAKK